ncbi:MAG: amidohydrolase [Anaerolineales bacterium]|nr:amidohydrolase [Anaerolineales bacterium]MDW8446723.1 amidohydrolase [Anaerolineales bacterium]
MSPTPAEGALFSEAADFVFHNGFVYTVDPNRLIVEAFALKGDRFVYVGDYRGVQAYIGSATQVFDLGGRMVLPAFVDSHAHATSGVSDLYEVSLYGIDSVVGYQQAIREFLAEHPDLEALRGAGWVNQVFGPKGPTAAMLDEVAPDIPAVLYSEDYHSVWANSKALELAGITKQTPDPEGGVIERDSAGNPSGTLRETAMDLVAEVIPPYTAEQYLEGLEYFQGFAHSLGITTVYIPSLPGGLGEALEALRKFEASGKMRIRFPMAIGINPEDSLTRVDELRQMIEEEKGGYYEIVGAKIFMDGVLEGSTAYLEEPYLHMPDSRGELLWEPQKYNEVCAALDRAGIQIHVHSIGDAATRITLDGFAYARQQNGRRDSRNMITHLQLVNPADLDRMAQLDVVAVPQPYWFVVDTYYTQAVEYVGRERADRQYPMKSFFDRGIVVASSSDYPVSWPPNPFYAIEIGVTRTVPADLGDIYVGADFKTPLNPQERVSVEQMIASFTINGAYAAFMEKQIGSIEVGKKADFIVLSQNILQVPATEIHRTKVLLTFFEGKEVYRSEEYTP